MEGIRVRLLSAGGAEAEGPSPARIEIVSCPTEITSGNGLARKIEARGVPFADSPLLFVGGNGVLEVTPEGYVSPLREGVGKVTVISRQDESVRKSLSISVVAPRMRLAGDGIRLDGSGNIRLT